jgi:hypothetical protein
MLYPGMGFSVSFFMVMLSAAKTFQMTAQIRLSEKNARTKGTLKSLLDFLLFNHGLPYPAV